MKIPFAGEAAALLLSLLLGLLFFQPAVSTGQIMGKEDIKFFIWLFWHYGESIAGMTNPLYASEIFYPYGISLSSTTVSPLLGALALMAGSDPWARITFLQVLSFALGGLFSFLLMRKFSGAFMPAMAGMIVYNFSVLHFEKAIHHLNYGLGMAFVPLFFLFYFQEKKNVPLLAVSLLAIALSESVLAVMALFVVFIDIARTYFEHSGRAVFSSRNTIILAGGVIGSLVLSELLAFSGLPSFMAYTVPPIPFICAVAFAIGPESAMRSERKLGLVKGMIIATVPAALYFLILFLQPGYPAEKDHIIYNVAAYSVPAENLLVPSRFTVLGAVIGGAPAYSEGAVYVGIAALLLIGAAAAGRIGAEERRHLEMALLMLLFSFPLISISGALLPTPFIAQPLFPLLLYLRASSRFMVFALLFMGIGLSMVVRRTLGGKPLIVAALLLLLVAERWPASSDFMLGSAVPPFYQALAGQAGDAPIFIYPRTSYHLLLDEVYFQTVHGKSISYGILSRAPVGGNDLISLYNGNATADEASEFAKDKGFSYVVLQKKRCGNPLACFSGAYDDYPENETKAIESALEGEFGSPVSDDWRMAVYAVR